MNFIFELVLEIFGGILEEILGSERVPKLLRCLLFALLLLPILVLLGIAFFAAAEAVPKVLLLTIAIAIIVVFACFVYRVNKFGILRPAKKEELPQILKLYRSVIGKPGCTWTVLYPNEATLYNDFRTKHLYVLRKGKTLIGAAAIVPENELDDLECWQIQENAREIARVVIAPQYQSKGYGKNLVSKLCCQLESMDCKAVHLLVSTKNHHALNLYRESGFRNKGQCERYDNTYYAYEKIL